jgi:hypothetical protein
MNEGDFTTDNYSLSHLKFQSWGDQDDSELRNRRKRCKYQKQDVITIEHFRFQMYKVFPYSCSFCKLCFKGTP